MTREEILEQERFTSRKGSGSVIMRPQCLECIHNISRDRCAIYSEKSEDIIKNKVECEYKEKEEG